MYSSASIPTQTYSMYLTTRKLTFIVTFHILVTYYNSIKITAMYCNICISYWVNDDATAFTTFRSVRNVSQRPNRRSHNLPTLPPQQQEQTNEYAAVRVTVLTKSCRTPYLCIMSRLIVKGLPARFEDSNLRDLFAPLGEVTDARIMKTADGRSRRFGFVGFRTRQDAARARNAMHKAFVQTSAVHVELARSKGDDSLPRPWSRYSSGSSRYDRDHPSADAPHPESAAPQPAAHAAAGEPPARTGDFDKDFSAFEQVAAPNVDTAGRVAARNAIQARLKSEIVQSKKNGSKGQLVERKHVTFEDAVSDDDENNLYEAVPDDSNSKKNPSNDADEDGDDAGNETALNDTVSDAAYFKSKIATPASDEDKNDATNPDEETPEKTAEDSEKPASDGSSSSESESEDTKKTKDSKPKIVKASDTATEHIDAGETGRLLVRNLAFSVNEEQLESTFETFGSLAEVHMVRDSSTGKSRGMAFVQFSIPEKAAKAMSSLDGSFLSGRIVHILPARPKPEPVEHRNAFAASSGSSSFKSQRETELKDSAKSGKDGASHHALHMSADAVARIAAEQHGVTKAELYGTSRGESGIAAVRLAVAEATVQGESKAFLLEEGIDLEKAVKGKDDLRAGTAASKMKRVSRTAFLVKNLPARTKTKQLEGIFKRFGNISRMVVVPSGVLAVVVFSTASDARRAYNGLAYTKFQDTPLYLEWLPVEALRGGKPSGVSNDKDSGTPLNEGEKDEHADIGKVAGDDDDGELNGCSVYVKNLNFETRDAGLKNHFEKALRKRSKIASSLRSAKVAMKRGLQGKEKEQLSMGFGFLEFRTNEDAMEAVKLAQNTTLDGHILRLQVSSQQKQGGAKERKALKRQRGAAKASKAGPKLMIRNVAFEATRRDVRQLFATFGQLKTVRMPVKLDGSHRGYAFVEFTSKNEAVAAYEALGSTHLYGRHLVIEYAEDSGEVGASFGELQEKAAKQVATAKRRRVEDIGNGGGESVKEGDNKVETDDVAMMRDELYG